MLEDDLLALVDKALRPLGAKARAGESYREPPLDVLVYHDRPVRLHWVPLFGRALSLVTVLRQPADIAADAAGYRKLVERIALVASRRFPPWRPRSGLAIGLSTIVVTPEPLRPEDDAMLPQALVAKARTRAVPMALFRLNLTQEAVAMALAKGPEGLFTEPETLADMLAEHFKRFVPTVEM